MFKNSCCVIETCEKLVVENKTMKHSIDRKNVDRNVVVKVFIFHSYYLFGIYFYKIFFSVALMLFCNKVIQ